MEAVQKKKRKGGRPAKKIKMEIRACVRFSKYEYFVIKEKASKTGLSASAYLREIAINGQVKNRLSDEEHKYVRQLIGMANNINQIAKACHAEGVLRAMQYFENYRSQIDEVLKKLKQ